MPGHKDPDAVIIRAADGFLACKSVDHLKDDDKTVKAEPEDIEPDQPTIEGEMDWKDMTKRQLDDYAAKQGIELDRRRSLKQMQEDFAEALAERE